MDKGQSFIGLLSGMGAYLSLLNISADGLLTEEKEFLWNKSLALLDWILWPLVTSVDLGGQKL